MQAVNTAHGGTVNVTSRPPGHTSFVITLPRLASVATAADAQRQALPVSVKAGGEVLLLVKVPVNPTVTAPPGGIEGS